MKSLQVITPNQKCIFNCPFCISKAHKHNNRFYNAYKENHDLWKSNLEKIIENNPDLGYVVITGTNEPMQSKDCVKNIIDIVRATNKDIQIEIQTRMYKQDDLYKEIDVTCYSISDFRLIDKIKALGNTIRFVFILTDTFNNKTLLDVIEKIPKEVTQLTFKVLHDSNGINEELDSWINNHRIDNNTLKSLNDSINTYKGKLSIRMDMDCMNSTNRYKVFREDGNLYDGWD